VKQNTNHILRRGYEFMELYLYFLACFHDAMFKK